MLKKLLLLLCLSSLVAWAAPSKGRKAKSKKATPVAEQTVEAPAAPAEEPVDSQMEAVADETVTPESAAAEMAAAAEAEAAEKAVAEEAPAAEKPADMPLPDDFEMPDLSDLDDMMKEAGL